MPSKRSVRLAAYGRSPKDLERDAAGPDAELVELVRERVYETEGLRPPNDQMVAVIQRPFRPTRPPVPRPESGPSPSPTGDVRFRLWGETYMVRYWIRVLLTVLAQLHKQHGDAESP